MGGNDGACVLRPILLAIFLCFFFSDLELVASYHKDGDKMDVFVTTTSCASQDQSVSHSGGAFATGPAVLSSNPTKITERCDKTMTVITHVCDHSQGCDGLWWFLTVWG